MPKRPPILTATDLKSLRFQVNEALREISDYVEELYGIDSKQFTSQNDINLNSYKLINVATPVADADAASKAYVDAHAGQAGVIVVSETTYGQTPSVGGSIKWAHEDHTHGTPAAPSLDDLSDVEITDAEQGDVLFRDATQWVNLHHGTDGQVLTTKGDSADPEWADPSVAELDDLTDVTITSAEQGDMLQRGATEWENTHHGTDGQVWTCGGHGANNAWKTIPTQQPDGWLSDTDKWVYVSASSFKISGKNVAARFPVGTKLKLTQTTAKYFYVVAAAYSTDTTVTITGGSDYSLANAAITSPCYSYQSCPQGFPQWFNYSETWTGFSSPPSGGVCQFCMEGRTVYMLVARSQNTSDATTMTITIPVKSANCYQHSWGTGMNAGSWIEYPCRAQIAPSATTATLSRQLTQAWANYGKKAWEGTIIYKAA